LLALMGILALGVYRRNRRAEVLEPSSALAMDDAHQEDQVQQSPIDPLLLPQGLQAEIMALDLELGPSEAPAGTWTAPLQPRPAPPSGADLSLSKLQWAQQLLAAGENELARVLLTSVAESLQSQLQQRGDSQNPNKDERTSPSPAVDSEEAANSNPAPVMGGVVVGSSWIARCLECPNDVSKACFRTSLWPPERNDSHH
jgi:hypothetical protein